MRTLPFALAAVALIAAPLVPSTAHAATATDTTKAFCTQLQTSQSAIGAIPATAKNRFSLISAEWTKMARFAPAAVKTDVTAIAAAYKTANGQSATAQKSTLAKITKAAQNVTAFTTKSCGAGGDGEREGGFAQLAECVAKKAGKLPERAPGGNGNGGGGGQNGGGRNGAGAGFPDLDEATQTALASCRSELGLGDGGGRGGRGGGARNNPEVLACLKKKGVTLPTAPAGQPGQRVQLNAKTQTALETCRKELGLPAPGQGNGPRNNVPSPPAAAKG